MTRVAGVAVMEGVSRGVKRLWVGMWNVGAGVRDVVVVGVAIGRVHMLFLK